MLLNLNRDIKFHTFEFLIGRELILFDIAVNSKYRQEILEIYKFLRNIILDENCIKYFIKYNLNMYILNIFSIYDIDTIKNLKIENVHINLNIDNYASNISDMYSILEKVINNISEYYDICVTINTLSIFITTTNPYIFMFSLYGYKLIGQCLQKKIKNNNIQILKVMDFKYVGDLIIDNFNDENIINNTFSCL